MVTEQLKKYNKIILLTASCVIRISVVFSTTWFFYSNQEFHFPSYALVSREKSLGLSITKEDVDIIDFISKYLTRSQILKYNLSSENLKDYQLVHWHSKGFAFMSYSFKTDHGNLIYLQILEQYKKKK